MKMGDNVQWPWLELPGIWIGGTITAIDGDVVRVSSGIKGTKEHIQSLAYLKIIADQLFEKFGVH